MYNLRYHIASLVSVFLALAIGVLFGGLIVDNSSTFDTAKMIENLQSQYDELRASNDALTAQDQALEGLSSELLAERNAGLLTGTTYAVLYSDEAVAEHAVVALEQAGARVVKVRVDETKLAVTGDSAVSVALTAANVAADAAEAELPAIVAAEWMSADSSATPITQALVEDGVLAIAGLPDGATRMPVINGVIDTATSDNSAAPLALGIALAADRAGAVGVGASVIGGSGVVATAAWDEGITGVATLGSSLGRYTLVRVVLPGGERGLFGLVDGATAAYAKLN